MRIKRQSRGERFVYFSPDEGRVRDFKKRFKVGDTLQARVLKRKGKKQAIIQIGDLKLVAYLKSPLREGDIVSLEVKQLSPHIILRQKRREGDSFSLYI